MAFRKPIRRIPTPVKQARIDKEIDRDVQFQEEVTGPVMNLDEETLRAMREADEAMARCICPKKGCPIHPD